MLVSALEPLSTFGPRSLPDNVFDRTFSADTSPSLDSRSGELGNRSIAGNRFNQSMEKKGLVEKDVFENRALVEFLTVEDERRRLRAELQTQTLKKRSLIPEVTEMMRAHKLPRLELTDGYIACRKETKVGGGGGGRDNGTTMGRMQRAVLIDHLERGIREQFKAPEHVVKSLISQCVFRAGCEMVQSRTGGTTSNQQPATTLQRVFSRPRAKTYYSSGRTPRLPRSPRNPFQHRSGGGGGNNLAGGNSGGAAGNGLEMGNSGFTTLTGQGQSQGGFGAGQQVLSQQQVLSHQNGYPSPSSPAGQAPPTPSVRASSIPLSPTVRYSWKDRRQSNPTLSPNENALTLGTLLSPCTPLSTPRTSTPRMAASDAIPSTLLTSGEESPTALTPFDTPKFNELAHCVAPTTPPTD